MVHWSTFGAAAAALALAGCGRGGPVAPAAGGTRPAAPVAQGIDAVSAERAKLSPDDRALVDAQEWCAVSTEEQLGAMGPPLKLDIKGQPVFVCCKGCRRKAEADPDKTLAAVAGLKAMKASGSPR